jgi:hypothetical protein
MKLKRDGDEFLVICNRTDLERLFACLVEAAESLSGPEFFIRVGWAKNDVHRAVSQARAVLDGKVLELELHLPEGSEEAENPRWRRDKP